MQVFCYRILSEICVSMQFRQNKFWNSFQNNKLQKIYLSFSNCEIYLQQTNATFHFINTYTTIQQRTEMAMLDLA